MGKQPNLSALKTAKFQQLSRRFPSLPREVLQDVISRVIDNSSELVTAMTNADDPAEYVEFESRLDQMMLALLSREAQASHEYTPTDRSKFKTTLSGAEAKKLGQLMNATFAKNQPRTAKSFLRPN